MLPLWGEAKKESVSSDKDIRSARNIEKQMVSSGGKMQERMAEGKEENMPGVGTPEIQACDSEQEPQKQNTPVRKEYSSFEEALRDFDDD